MTFDGVSPMAELRSKNGREEPWKLTYFGVGNENWGCGGNMRPEFYADQFRRYATYVRNYGDNKIYKIACGPNVEDYEWTDKFMALAGQYCNAISLHYYTRIDAHDWSKKGSATGFPEKEYWSTIVSALWMEELISNHLEIMRRHDPERHVDLVVDEWGHVVRRRTRHEPRLPLISRTPCATPSPAAITLNIFNRHADSVTMANIAQTINVLQAMVLTDGEKMLLTPDLPRV